MIRKFNAVKELTIQLECEIGNLETHYKNLQERYANREISYHEYEEYKNIFTQKQDLIYNTIDQLLKKLKKGN